MAEERDRAGAHDDGSPRTKADLAHLAIEQLIVREELAPGSLVSEAQLMALTGLGRTPVREALQRLARARMVEIHSSRGVRIPTISVEEQLRMLELRHALEPWAVRLACDRADARDLATLAGVRRLLDPVPGDIEAYAEILRRIHLAIVSAAHNEYLVDAIAPVQGLSRRFWLSQLSDPAADIARGASFYVRVLDAIADRDAVTAERIVLDLNAYLVDFAHDRLVPARRGGFGDG